MLLLWAGAFYAEVRSISGRAWTFLAGLWLIWLIVLTLHPARSFSGVAISAAIGLALLAPCLPVLWAYTAWAIGGFRRKRQGGLAVPNRSVNADAPQAALRAVRRRAG